jgi:hypothetical protein
MPDEELKFPDSKWHIEPEGTMTHHVQFVLGCDMGKLRAGTKWDGCTHLWLDVDTEDECYHHICDLDEFIAFLQALRDKARRHFDGEFGVSGVAEEEMNHKIEMFKSEE